MKSKTTNTTTAQEGSDYAFPLEGPSEAGLSKREYYAAKFMAAYIIRHTGNGIERDVANAIAAADELLKQLNP